MSSAPSCKTCFHYRATPGIETVYEFGICTRFPPAVTSDSEGDPISIFPMVNEDERCGEWKASQ